MKTPHKIGLVSVLMVLASALPALAADADLTCYQDGDDMKCDYTTTLSSPYYSMRLNSPGVNDGFADLPASSGETGTFTWTDECASYPGLEPTPAFIIHSQPTNATQLSSFGYSTDVNLSGGCDVPSDVCGDGAITGTEACDDGNTDAGDGCSDVCAIEDGWECSGEPSMCTEIEVPPEPTESSTNTAQAIDRYRESQELWHSWLVLIGCGALFFGLAFYERK